MTSIGSALLGAILALVVLAWLNDGELEYVTAGTEVTTEQADGYGTGDDDSGAAETDMQELNDSVVRLREQVVFIQATLEAVESDGLAPEEGAEATDDGDADAATATDDEAADEDEGVETPEEPEDDATDEADVDEGAEATATERRATATRTPPPTATDEPTATPTRRPAGPTPTLRIGP